MIPGGAGTPVFPGKGAPAPGARGPDAFVLRERAAEGTALCICPLRPFLLFLPAAIHPSFLHASLLAVTPCHCPVCPSVLPSSHPAIRLSIHPAVHPAFFRPPFPCSARLSPGLVRGSVPPGPSIPGPSSRGRAPTPISSTAPALLSDRPSLGILPESLSRESFRSIVPGNCSRTACLPQSFSPPATRLPSVLPSCGTVANCLLTRRREPSYPWLKARPLFPCNHISSDISPSYGGPHEQNSTTGSCGSSPVGNNAGNSGRNNACRLVQTGLSWRRCPCGCRPADAQGRSGPKN